MVSNNYMCFTHFEFIMEMYEYICMQHAATLILCHSLLFSSPFVLSSSFRMFFSLRICFYHQINYLRTGTFFTVKSLFFTVERMCMDDDDGDGGSVGDSSSFQSSERFNDNRIKFLWLHDLFMGFNAGDTVSAMSTTKKRNKKHRPFKMYFCTTTDQKFSRNERIKNN